MAIMLGTDRPPLFAETSVLAVPSAAVVPVVVVSCSFPFLPEIVFVVGGVLPAVAVELVDGCVSTQKLQIKSS